MPELPEIETTVRNLNKNQTGILNIPIINVWTDFPKIVKKISSRQRHKEKIKIFEQFKKEIKNKKIKKIWRRGKNIIFELSSDYFMLVHQKMTGHFLVGIWNLKGKTWKPKTPGPLSEKVNDYIHLLFIFANGKMLALSDLRKFAKVELLTKEELEKELNLLGPEPLNKYFTFEKFKKCLKRKKKGKIKQVLMNQKVIAGIGNIYSDEILFEAKVNPLKDISKLSEKNLKDIYLAIKKILKLAIKLQGESISDYRLPSGEKGKFDKIRKVYRKEGQKCLKCGSIIKKIKIGGRSAHFCPKCQK